jgi:hypothetical protein
MIPSPGQSVSVNLSRPGTRYTEAAGCRASCGPSAARIRWHCWHGAISAVRSEHRAARRADAVVCSSRPQEMPDARIPAICPSSGREGSDRLIREECESAGR